LPYERIHQKIPWLGRLVALVCATSFGIYMVHVLLLSLLKGGRLGFVLGGGSIGPGVGILLAFLLAMPLSIGIIYLMQRIPILSIWYHKYQPWIVKRSCQPYPSWLV
jgi:surface polysaccharide O-acyltransferase-like enzyme